MPWLRQPRPPRHHGYGRPRLIDDDPALIEYFAVLVDVCGWSGLEVARWRLGEDLAEKQRKQVARQVSAGRELLAPLGILPWSAFLGKRVPRGWEQTQETADWMVQWRAQARVFPAQGDEIL